MYYGDVALSTKPVMPIWKLLIPATRAHVIQSKVLAMIIDNRLQCHLVAGISVTQISIT